MRREAERGVAATSDVGIDGYIGHTRRLKYNFKMHNYYLYNCNLMHLLLTNVCCIISWYTLFYIVQ